MPTYQYACTQCGSQLEVVQSFTDDALTTCAECQGRLRKVYSAVGVVFKGSGFYRTDSRSGSSSSSSASSNGSGSSTDSSSSSGSSESNGAADKSTGSSDSGTATKGSGESTSTSSGATTTKAA